MNLRQIVLERDDRATEAPLEAPDLDRPRVDPIVRSPYLTAPEAAAYVRSPTAKAFYYWRKRHGVPAYGSRNRHLYLKRDLDECLKPVSERGRRPHFHAHRGGRG